MAKNKKEAFYFSHDANARNDEKILELRSRLGWEGYGLYWAVIECLRESTNYKLRLDRIGSLSIQLACNKETLQKFLETCAEISLIAKDESFFWSDSLIRRMKLYKSLKKQKVRAGRKGAEKRWQKDSTCHDDAIAENGKIKEIKENKIKENKECVLDKKNTPTLDEVREFFLSSYPDNSFTRAEAEKFWSYYESQGWITAGSRPQAITNWKSKVMGWMNNTKNFNTGTESNGKQKQSTFDSRLNFQFDPDSHKQDVDELTAAFGSRDQPT